VSINQRQIDVNLKRLIAVSEPSGSWGFASVIGQIFQQCHSDFARLAGGTIPFIRRYSTICP